MTLFAAIAAVVALAILWPKQFGPVRPASASTLGEVIDAMREARSLHLQWFVADGRGGPLRLSSEMWYSRAHGYFERRVDAGTTILSTSDTELTCHPTARVAVRRDPLVAPGVSLEAMLEQSLRPFAGELRRAPDGDAIIDGQSCNMFVGIGNGAVSRPSLTEQEAGQVRLWMNGGDTRRVEFWWFCEGSWQISWRMEVDSRAAVDAVMFVPAVPAGYREIDPRLELEQAFDLKAADATVEQRGFVVALHRSRRLPGGYIGTIATVRPTESMRKRLSEMSKVRRVAARIPMQIVVEGSYEPIRPSLIAELTDRSMQIVWLILPANVEPVGSVREFDVRYQMADRSEGHVLSHDDGKKPFAFGSVRLRVQALPESSVQDFSAIVYDDLAKCAWLRPAWFCALYGDPFSNTHERSHLQGGAGGIELRVTREAFVAAVRAAFERHDTDRKP